MIRSTASRRRGAIALESAFAHLAFVLLILLLVVGAVGSLRYQTVSWMACEAARYASVHGKNYAKETNSSAPTTQEIRDQIVLPLAVNMDPAQLTVQVDVVDMVTGQVTPWDDSTKAPTSSAGTAAAPQVVTNRVRVTVRYQWFPEMFLAGPIMLTGSAEVPLAF